MLWSTQGRIGMYLLLHVDSILIIFSSFLSRKYKFCLTRLCPNPTFVEHIASNSSSSINTQIVREIHPLLCNIIISAAFQSHQILLWSSRVFLTTKYKYLPELFLYMHLNKQEIEFLMSFQERQIYCRFISKLISSKLISQI